MRPFSAAGLATIHELAQKHGFSSEAVVHMLEALVRGNSQMAQFNHPEFAGNGQWMRGGMTMVSDMFNNQLKSRVDGLCQDLAALVASQPDLLNSGSSQSQSQGSWGPSSSQSQASWGPEPTRQPGDYLGASLFVPPAAGQSGHWWGPDLGQPSSSGAQNNVRYAWFPQTRRLAIEVNGSVTLYDTLDHQIYGFSQQQSVGGSLSFQSQNGLVSIASLPVVDGAVAPVAPRAGEPKSAAWASELAPTPESSSVAAEEAASRDGASRPAAGEPAHRPEFDIFATLEKLAQLHAKGILTDEEFSSKKAELLSRL